MLVKDLLTRRHKRPGGVGSKKRLEVSANDTSNVGGNDVCKGQGQKPQGSTYNNMYATSVIRKNPSSYFTSPKSVQH